MHSREKRNFKCNHKWVNNLGMLDIFLESEIENSEIDVRETRG